MLSYVSLWMWYSYLLGHHAVVQDSVLQRCVAGVLAVKVLADHLNMSLLSHLLCWLQAKTDVTSNKTRAADINRAFTCMHTLTDQAKTDVTSNKTRSADINRACTCMNTLTDACTDGQTARLAYVCQILMKHVYPAPQDSNLHLFGHIRLSKLLLHHDCGAFTRSAGDYSEININIVIYA